MPPRNCDSLFIPDPIENITRRRLIAALPIMGLMTAGISCGDDNTEADGATVTVDDYFGPVTIPAEPERVIIEDGTTLALTLGLGVTPVATGVNRNSLPTHLADQLDGVEDITAENGIDIERALTLDPDLILMIGGSPTNAWNSENYDRYSAVVPTFAYGYAYTYIEDIYANTREVARALGRDEKAEEQIREYEERVAELRQRVIDAGLGDRPVSAIRIMQGGSYWIQFGTSEAIAFRALGIAQPEGQRDPEEFGIEVSLEQLRLLNEADTIFLYIDDNATTDGQEVLDSPLWQGLEPVRNGRVHTVSSGIWNSSDLASLQLILDDIERYFINPAEA